jgi:hypothetical protein
VKFKKFSPRIVLVIR